MQRQTDLLQSVKIWKGFLCDQVNKYHPLNSLVFDLVDYFVIFFIKSMNHSIIHLFVVLRHFQHCTGHITTGSWKGRGNQYIQFVRVLYCKLLTNGKQLPAFPLEAVPGTEPRPQRWEARVLLLCHHGPTQLYR